MESGEEVSTEDECGNLSGTSQTLQSLYVNECFPLTEGSIKLEMTKGNYSLFGGSQQRHISNQNRINK